MSSLPDEASDRSRSFNLQATTNEAASFSSSPGTALASEEPWSVEAELSKLPSPVPANPTSPIPFLHLLERLKTTKREGWRRFGIASGESISDHMYRMSIITMLAPSTLASRLDITRCTKMALVHDMAELLVGDITPVDRVPKAEKSRREASTMDFLTRTMLSKSSGGFAQGQEMKEIWQEYENSITDESLFVHDVDKIELVLQMIEYERSSQGQLDLSEFLGVLDKVKVPEMQDWGAELLRERDEFWKGLGQGQK